MGGDADLNISKQSVDDITKGLKSVIGELKELGGFDAESSSLQGSGFGAMSMSALEAGDGGLAGDFEGFCEDWEWGVRALVTDANALADKLGLAAGRVHAEDEYWGQNFRVGLNSLGGNPYASEDEAGKKSYGEILDSGYGHESPGDVGKAFGDMGQEWKDTGRSLMDEGMLGAHNHAMADGFDVSRERQEEKLDEVFGPSPEERAEPRGEGGGQQDRNGKQGGEG